jgi:hypothetical protein
LRKEDISVEKKVQSHLSFCDTGARKMGFWRGKRQEVRVEWSVIWLSSKLTLRLSHGAMHQRTQIGMTPQHVRLQARALLAGCVTLALQWTFASDEEERIKSFVEDRKNR